MTGGTELEEKNSETQKLRIQSHPELETGRHRRSERNERLQGMVAHDLILSSGEAEARAYLWM